jgi:hypothetical protein
MSDRLFRGALSRLTASTSGSMPSGTAGTARLRTHATMCQSSRRAVSIASDAYRLETANRTNLTSSGTLASGAACLRRQSVSEELSEDRDGDRMVPAHGRGCRQPIGVCRSRFDVQERR